VLYQKNPYPLPVSLAIGDKVLIEAAGAYTRPIHRSDSTAFHRCAST